jgi:RNA polymerase sigma factor (sigma-70 family)
MSLLKSTLTQYDLVQGCVRNERRSQELLYKQYCQSLLAISSAYAKNNQDAIEILQDSFLKIFQNIHLYDSEKSTLYTWMRTIVVRTSIDFLRKGKNNIQSIEWDEQHDPVIEAEALHRMTTDQILNMLKQLSETTRAVFNLYISEGFTHKEIGELLKISEGTSKWHLSEARKFLIASLKTEERA